MREQISARRVDGSFVQLCHNHSGCVFYLPGLGRADMSVTRRKWDAQDWLAVVMVLFILLVAVLAAL
jgi:hypothetical protein